MRYFALSFLLVAITASAEEIGSLSIGYTTYPNGADYGPIYQNHTIPASIPRFENGQGVSLGLLLPIRFPIVDSHYKVRATFSRIEQDRIHADNWSYIAASNTFLLGKEINFDRLGVVALPELGLGLEYENIYEDWGTGYIYNRLFIDYSLTIHSKYLSEYLGLMINLERAFENKHSYSTPDNRIQISLLLGV